MTQKLPTIIDNFIQNSPLHADEIGESPCSVYSFQRGNDRFFLKTSPPALAPTTYSVSREAAVLCWLAGRLSVPEVVMTAENGNGAFMITRAIAGEPLFTRIDAGRPVTDLFLEALRQVQAVPAADCPFASGSAQRLAELDYLLEHSLTADTYDLNQWPGLSLSGPDALRTHLYATCPIDDPVFSHGDLGDSNILIDSRETLSFIDLGRGGRADRWVDIAFLCRNLREEVSEDAEQEFLQRLGHPDAPARRQFFEQLDELF